MTAATLEGIVKGMPEHEYHARPELSSTEARLLLHAGGPARYRWAKDHPPMIAPSRKFDVGTAAHAKILGAGAEVVIVDANDWRTKAAQESRDDARAQGKAPLLRHEFEAVEAMAESVLANPFVRALFEQPGESEASVFATDPETGAKTRARFDFLPNLTLPRPVAFDLKTTASEATPDEFGKAVARYGYHIQQEFYRHTLNHSGAEGNQPLFVFVVVEKDAPFLCSVMQVPLILAERGKGQVRRAINMFAESTRTDEWPGLPEDVQFIDIPNWLFYEEDAA